MAELITREQWSSRFVFVLATTGAAVGLGNIWKFPYMVGNNGGSLFVLLYLAAVLLIGLPVMIAEMLMGRRGRSNPVDSLQKLAKENNCTARWAYLGWWGAVTLLLIFSFYSVVASWAIAYMFDAWRSVFHIKTAAQIFSLWQHFLSQPWKLLFWDSLFIIMTGYIVTRGVSKGLEKASLYMVPALFILLIGLAAYSMAIGDRQQAWHFLFGLHIVDIKPHVVIAATGQAFFSLAVGAFCILVYGSYLPRQVSWVSMTFFIVALDVLVAILAGLAIFPLVFADHLSPQGGPGLMFEILPIAFSHMPAGNMAGGLFFLLLIFAAWTSSISLAEPLVILLVERYHLSRLLSAIIVSFIAWILSIGSVLSFNLWQNYKLFGRWNFFEGVTDLATNIMLPIGGLFIAIFVGWKMRKPTLKEEFNFKGTWLLTTWYFLIRYVAPIGIILIIISPLL